MKKVIVSIAIASLLSTSAFANTALVGSATQNTAASAAVDAKSAQFSQGDISAILGGANSQGEVGVMTQEQMTATDGAAAPAGYILAGLFITYKVYQQLQNFQGKCKPWERRC